MEAMDCPVANLRPSQVATCLGLDADKSSEGGICFLFAQTFHPSLRGLAPVRKELGVPTILNRLGPLANPVPVNAAVIGVNLEEHGNAPRRGVNATRHSHRFIWWTAPRTICPTGIVFARVLQKMGVSRALIVHGEEGLDEVGQ